MVRGLFSGLSVESFFSHNTEIFRRDTLLFFREFLVSEKFKDRRGRGKGYDDLPLIFSLSQYRHI